MKTNPIPKKIVLIDDDYVIREVVKIFLAKIRKSSRLALEVYSSANGMEGLGMVIATSPDIIVIDSTLPKYSGKELVEFLTTNPRFNNPNTTIIVTHEDTKPLQLPKHYVTLNKDDPEFLKRLLVTISNNLSITQSARRKMNPILKKLMITLGNRAVMWANRGNKLLHSVHQKFIIQRFLYNCIWLFTQIVSSFYLTIMYLFCGKVYEENRKQREADKNSFRVRYYPTFGTIYILLFTVFLQSVLYLTGGITIPGLRLKSIFAIATSNNQLEIQLADSLYGAEIEYNNGSLQLREQETNLPQQIDASKRLQQENIPDNETSDTEPANMPEEATADSNPEDLDESTTQPDMRLPDPEESGSTTNTKRFATTGAIIFNQGIEYSKLNTLLEESTLNDFQSSISESTLNTESAQPGSITYQLSPNKVDWYYFEADKTLGNELGHWERTGAGVHSSNTVQEVNKYIGLFDGHVPNEKIVYLKAFLQSDGRTQVLLNRIVIDRDVEMITATGRTEGAVLQPGDPITIEIQEPESLSFLRPVILNAAYANGGKYIAGRVDLDEGVEIHDDELSSYSITIYYAPDTDITKPATSTGEEIGTASLEKIDVNGVTQYVFELKTASGPGGYVTAQIEYRADNKQLIAKSDLANPVENATLTVTETGDQGDASPGDTACDHDLGTPGVQCTLRAAIEESNALAGNDNIYFNIPDTDGNYLDYDNQSPGSNSGDGIGQDDFWSIRPLTAFPTVSEGVIIDATTQTANQGNTNTYGPEMEIYDEFAIGSYFLSIQADNTTINGFAFDDFHNYLYLHNCSGISITNNYIGCDSRCALPSSYTENYQGVTLSAVTNNISIGTLGNGNTFAGFYRSIIDRGNSTLISDNTMYFGNRSIYTESTANIQNNEIFDSRLAISVVGGEAVIRGNYIHNNLYGILQFVRQQDSRIDVSDDVFSKATIGGQSLFTGSRCGGLEKNCIESNEIVGINAIDTLPLNEATLFEDNDFGTGNSTGDNYAGYTGKINIKQEWTGLFELFSNGIRRTDLTDFEHTIQNLFQEFTRIFVQTDVSYTGAYNRSNVHWVNHRDACLDPLLCPDQGIAGSNGMTSVLVGYDNIFSTQIQHSLLAVWIPWRLVPQYIIDNSGTVAYEESVVNFDERHFASQPFSFDGDATTHPITTAPLRVIDGENYYDRGEPWTDNPDATRDIATTDYSRFQIMEVEFVDANPVLQNDGTYVITVDSTTNEDNVSLSGYDDGGGVYSGGGNEGPDGLPDGSTSLKEAIYVANQHAGVDYIHFDIPVDDPSHVCYQDDEISGQVTPGNVVNTTVKDNPNCGGTQIDPDHPYSWFDLSTTGTQTLTSPTIIDGNTQDGAQKNTAEMGETLNHVIKIDTGDTIFDINGGSTEITGIALTDGEASIYMDSDNNHVHGIFMGVDPSGLLPIGQNHKIRVRGANNVIGSNLDNSNDVTETNLLNAATNSCISTWNHVDSKFIDIGSLLSQNPIIARNYMNINKKIEAPDTKFISQNSIHWGSGGSFAGEIHEIIIKENIVANSTVGIGAPHVPFRIFFDIQNNRINTDWEGNKRLNKDICESTPAIFTGGLVKNSTNGFSNFGGTLRNNFIHTTSPNDSFLHAALYISFRNNDVLENNHFVGQVLAYGDNLSAQPAKNLTIRNNVIEEAYGNGFTIAGFDESTIEGNVIRNNCQHIPGAEFVLNNTNNNTILDNNIGVPMVGSYNPNHCNSAIGLLGTAAIGNTISENILHSKDYTVLDLAGGTEDVNKVTENDSGDTDTGPNDLQNYPEITKVEYLGAGQYRVSGDLDENSSESPFDIEICESYDHPSGHGGCIQTLGHTTASSPWQTIVTIPESDGTDGRIFSTLATNSNGSTSEFSANFVADTSNPDYEVLEYDIELVYPIDGIEIDDRTPQLDWNPAVETETGYLDPDIHHYEIYVDGAYYSQTDDAITQYQITSPLALGNHTWQIVAFRQLDDSSFIETARSNVEDFNIVEADYSFEPVYPVDVTIDDTTPLFDWTDLDESEDFDEYDLYIDGELVEEGISESEYQLANSQQLTANSHTWYVIAIRIEPNGSHTQVGRTDTAQFDIVIPEPPPLPDTGDGDQGQPGIVSEESTLSPFLPLLPITGILTISIIGGLFFSFSGSFRDVLSSIGILIGVVIKRKKKYWGIVFDETDSNPIPFAIIRVLRNNKLIKQTVTDLDGRYALVVDEGGAYDLVAQADGYRFYKKKLNVNLSADIVEDIPMLKLDTKVNYLKRLYYYNKPKIVEGMRAILLILMILGWVFTVYVTYHSPHFINYLILGIYGVLFFFNVLNLYLYLKKREGKVIEKKSGEGVGGAGVRIFQRGKQLDVVLSNAKGVIKFNLKPGIYRFLAHKRGYEMADEEKGRGIKITLRKGKLHKNIKMRRQEQTAERTTQNIAYSDTPFGAA